MAVSETPARSRQPQKGNQAQLAEKLEEDLKAQAQTILELTGQLDTAVRSQTEARQELNTWQDKCEHLEAESKCNS